MKINRNTFGNVIKSFYLYIINQLKFTAIGLDSYLSKRTYVKNWDFMGPKEKHEVTIKKGGVIRSDIKPERVSEIIEEVGYWRKANAIHNWFVQNVQDGRDECQESYVDRDKLQELYDACVLVRDNTKLVEGKITNGYSFKEVNGKLVKDPIIIDGKTVANNSVAEELLPSTSGFFFGSTDYDEYYFQDILDTIEIIEPLLKEDDHGDYYYRASW